MSPDDHPTRSGSMSGASHHAPLWIPLLTMWILALAASAGCPRPPSSSGPRLPLAAGRDPHLIPRALLFGNPGQTAVQLSPDGRRLSFLAPSNGVLNIWVRPVGRGNARPVTRETRRGIRGYFWTPDSRGLLFSQDKDGDENYRIFLARADGKGVKQLTPGGGVRAQVLKVSHLHPHTILVTTNQRRRSLFDVYRLDLQSGRLSLDTPNPGNVVGWVADHQMKVRAARAMASDGDKLLLVRDAPKGAWRTLRRWTPLESGVPMGFTPDGQGVFVVDNKGVDKMRLIEVRISDGKVTQLFASPLADVSRVAINPRSHRIEAVTVEYLKKRWVALDPGFGKDIRALARLARGNRFGIVSRSLDGRRWVVAVGGPTMPARYYLYQRPARTLRLLLDTRPELGSYRLASQEPVIIEARDHMKLVCYLTRPPRPLPGKQPLVLFVHGGPWSRDKWAYNPWVQWLANRGYMVLQVNYRGSAGFGKRYLNAGNREWGRKMQHDLTDAVRWAIRTQGVDRRRVAILGGSYGGYAALAGVAFTPGLYAAAVDIVGPSSILTLLASIPPYWKPLMTVFSTRVGDLKADREMLRRRSPLYFAHRIRTPLAIFQGANDPRVKISESDQMVQAIRRRGGRVLYVVYPDEGHGFKGPANRLDFIGRTEGFLSRHLGGRLEPFRKIPGSSAQIR